MKKDQEIEKILSTCSASTKATALTFFPECSRVPFAENIHDNLIDGKANKVAIARYHL